MSSKVPAGVTGEKNRGAGVRRAGEWLTVGRQSIHANLNFWNAEKVTLCIEEKQFEPCHYTLPLISILSFYFPYSLINSTVSRSQNIGCSLLFVLSAAALFILLRAWCSADDPINVSGAGTSIVGGVPGGRAPSSLAVCLLLTCSSPDVAFRAPPWRSACGPVPVALSRKRRKPKEKGLNLSGESHCHPHFIFYQKWRKNKVLKMCRQEGRKIRKKSSHTTMTHNYRGTFPCTLLLIRYEGIIVELSWPIWHKAERRGSFHYWHCSIIELWVICAFNRLEPGLALQP